MCECICPARPATTTMSKFRWHKDGSRLTDFGTYLYYKEFDDRDFTFIVAGKRFPVHRLMIKHSSDRFRELFVEWDQKKVDEVDLADIGVDVPAKSFQVILQYIYTGAFNFKDITDKKALDLLQLTNKFGLWVLASELSSSIGSMDYVTIWNVWDFYMAADQYQLQELLDSTVKFIDTHAIETLNQKAVCKLPGQLFKNILSRDTLFAQELEIAVAAVNWLKANKEVKDEVKKMIFGCVRWSLITGNEWNEFIKPTSLFTDEEYQKYIENKKEKKRVNSLLKQRNVDDDY